MRKKIGIAAVGILGALILGIGIFFSDATRAEPSMTAEDIKETVENQYPGKITDMKLEKELKQEIYRVKIKEDQKEYSLKLDGDNGEVLDIKETTVKGESAPDQPVKKKKPEKHPDKKEKPKQEPKEDDAKKEQRETVITPQEATEIALKEFSGEVDEVELEEENGRLIYEVEIERGNLEAEIEIDAYTGEIIVIEIEED